MRKPTAFKVKVRYGLIGAALLIAGFVLLAMLTGCAVGRSLDANRPMVGVQLDGDLGPAVDAAKAAGGIIGSIFGGPAGAVAGEAIAGAGALAIGGLFGLRRGERKGWDEAVESVKGKPAVAPTVPDGGVSASRVGPAGGGAA